MEKVGDVITFQGTTARDRQLNADFNRENPANPKFSSSIREKYITCLVVLWRYGLLDDKQKEQFANSLWAKQKPNGFPADTDYYDFAFMWFPYPSDIYPEKLFRNYINQAGIDFGNTAHKEHGLEMTGGYNHVLSIILGTYNADVSYQRDSEGINILIEKIIK
jgi:hypothetical protein